jgi:AraC family transcriptional regulator
VLATTPGTWSGFDLEDLRLGPGCLPPEASLLHHVICTVRCDSPVNLRWRENGASHRQTVDRGDMLLRSQQELVEFGWDAPMDVLVLGISMETMHSVSADMSGSGDCQLLPIFGAKDQYLHQLMLALREDLAAGCPTGRLLGESICASIATHALQRYAVNKPRIKDYRHGLSADRLGVVLSYIEAHLEEDLSIKRLAALAGIGLHYFRKLFRISTGLTVHEYVIQTRISRARHLLQRTHLSIVEIALMVGFSSQSHFTAEFRRRLRVTPAVYRSTLAPSRKAAHRVANS